MENLPSTTVAGQPALIKTPSSTSTDVVQSLNTLPNEIFDAIWENLDHRTLFKMASSSTAINKNIKEYLTGKSKLFLLPPKVLNRILHLVCLVKPWRYDGRAGFVEDFTSDYNMSLARARTLLHARVASTLFNSVVTNYMMHNILGKTILNVRFQEFDDDDDDDDDDSGGVLTTCSYHLEGDALACTSPTSILFTPCRLNMQVHPRKGDSKTFYKDGEMWVQKGEARKRFPGGTTRERKYNQEVSIDVETDYHAEDFRSLHNPAHEQLIVKHPLRPMRGVPNDGRNICSLMISPLGLLAFLLVAAADLEHHLYVERRYDDYRMDAQLIRICRSDGDNVCLNPDPWEFSPQEEEGI